MSIQDFIIGDRVIVRDSYPNFYVLPSPPIGTVVEISSFSMGIQFDKLFCGHSCYENAIEGYGWYVPVQYVDIYRDTTIVFEIL